MKTIPLLLACAALTSPNFQLSTAFAQGTTFTYQGVLSANGAGVNGSNDLTFTLYDASTGGNTVGTSNVVNDLVTSNGLFTVTLDFGASAFSGSARWLQIAVRAGASTGAFTNLTPRQAVTATPYAFTAGNLSGTLPATQLTGTVPNAQLSASVSLLGTNIDSAEITDGTVTTNDLDASVLNSTFWKLGGNTGTTAGTNFLGTTDLQPLEFRVNNQRGLRLAYAADASFGPSVNVIGGYSGNFVTNGVVGATISGGGAVILTNRVMQDLGTVSGGGDNTASGLAATVAGGSGNTALGGFSIVAGGAGNTAISDYATVGGGFGNTATNIFSTVGGGSINIAAHAYATVSGGSQNIAGNYAATIGGGQENLASGDYATIPGGYQNVATNRAFAAGFRAKANHPGDFVWADNQDADFTSTGANQFLIRAAGGVAIGTNDPAGAALRVAGSIKADSYLGMGSTLMLGTTDNQPLEFKVNNQRGLRLEYAAKDSDQTINVIGGYSGNFVGGGVVGATIAGGGTTNILGFSLPNQATADFATIGGGYGNTAGGRLAAVGGGDRNTANGFSSTVGGGQRNQANGSGSTVPGGSFNVAGGDYSFAAGHLAKANHQGAFVWADSEFADFASTANNQFNVRATGGARFFTGGTGLNLDSDSVVFSGSAQTGRFANAVGFDFNTGLAGTNSGVLIEQGLNESSGIFFDGDSITLWSPGDNSGNGFRLLRILDEDEMVDGIAAAERFYVDGSGGFGSDGGATIAGGATIGGNGTIAGTLSVGGALTVNHPNGTVSVVNDQFTPALVMTGGPAPGILRVRNALEIWPNTNGTSAGKIDVRDTSGAVQFVADGNTGNVGIGTASPGATLFVRKSNADALIRNSIVKVETQFTNGMGGFSPIFEIYNEPGFALGSLTLAGGNAYKLGGGSWSVESDARLKKNVADLHGSLDRLLRLRSVSFEYKDPAKGVGPGPQIGFIAQEVREVMPQWVTEGPDGMLAVSVTGFESLTVDALRELRAEKDQQIGELKAENAELKARLENLEQLVTQKLSGETR